MTVAVPFAQESSENFMTGSSSSDRIAVLADELMPKLNLAGKSISKVNSQIRLLSFNAQIEASRASGETGAASGVVAAAMRELADKTAQVLNTLESETAQANATLGSIITTLATDVRGTRVADLALTNIDLIDRNLYERSCDVRWWATDSSCVAAATTHSDETHQFCSQRFGVILNSYTVYYDLVLCDLDGKVVANGRPHKYHSVGRDCSRSEWFKSALATKTGEEFGFESVHESQLVNNERVLVYSCCVRQGGEVAGDAIGVLGIIFNWDALAQTIVDTTPLSPEEKSKTRVCITDDSGLILADTQNRALVDSIKLDNWEEVKRLEKGYVMTMYEGHKCCLGYAKSPGYETYCTGWHSLLLQI